MALPTFLIQSWMEECVMFIVLFVPMMSLQYFHYIHTPHKCVCKYNHHANTLQQQGASEAMRQFISGDCVSQSSSPGTNWPQPITLKTWYRKTQDPLLPLIIHVISGSICDYRTSD